MQNLRIRIFFSFIIISFVLIIDILSKKYIEALDQTIIFNSYITFYKINNQGIAFSLFDNLNEPGLFALNLIIIGILIIILRELYFNLEKSLLYTIGLSLILAGGLGNLVDRFDNSSVTDFITLHLGDFYFPAIFNLADVSITLGAILIVYHFIKENNGNNKV